MKEKFDVLINLEKIPGVCALSDMIDAWGKYGFRFETIDGTYRAYEKGLSFISYIEGKTSAKVRGYWQQVLIEMLGIPWKQQPYIIGYESIKKETFDVGFNYEVGSKWPHKAMAMNTWKKLEKRLLGRGYSVSWQQGQKSLFEYMDWISSCRLIISNDSLGLHLAFAFRKKLIGLFGPTDPNEVYFYNKSEIVFPEQKCPRMPCCATACKTEWHCMSGMDAKKIEQAVVRQLAPAHDEQDRTCILRTGTR
jgi:heptosyltransferase-2